MNFSRFLLLFSLLLVVIDVVQGQKVLQIERSGTPHTIKFYEGDALDVKLHDESFWRSGILVNIDLTNEQLEFSFGMVDLDELSVIRSPRTKKRADQFRKFLILPALSYALFAGVDLIVNGETNPNVVAYGAALPVTALLLQPLFNIERRYRIKGHRRVRLLDLTF